MAILKPFSNEILLAENGQEAVDKYGEFKPDLVLMDIQMPVMDGFMATRKIRKFEEENNLSRTKIVALTANALEEEKNKCFEAGMDDFIAKPFKINDIKKLLATF